ncbi:DUF6542 domain-containing protein [Corynebacterium striatum]|uniref:DUF6542 domain-containing protein n=1 Tax=Corynebacterium striatum TaxID=43770 RepID=UPI00101D6C30|nr:DUF6542 domain-containing protein [Corynebacterium striatum]KAA1263006.1 DNA helicase [Corynebacterium striatum]MDK8789566.1 DNA helicase [Corynebacterium striatum]HCT5224089.1 DNA helicase [Corynebacterium striatum]HEI8410818.1 DNA helicase [Corynebacterium striatum]
MSLAKNRNHRAGRESAAVHGLTLPKALFGLVAALIVAALITIVVGSIGWPFFAVFTLGALAMTFLVNPRGLYLLVISIPLLFTVAIVSTSWILAVQAAPEGASPFSTTSLLTTAFPFLQRFPWLIIVFLLCALLAVFRLWNGKNNAKSRNVKAQVARRAQQKAERRNRDERLSVAELIARDKKAKETARQRTGRLREMDREERRRQQAVEREARERAASVSSAEYDDSDFAPRRPDPQRRAGDVDKQPAKEPKAKPASPLDENLYED